MKISVIVCTYNRGRSLARALESLSASVMPATAEWEVLVMDNNSNDETREVAQRVCELNPSHFRYLFEPTQGKSHALNTAIRESIGEILAFTDDDVTVEPSWLQNLTSVFEHEEYAGAAGRILPAQSFDLPPWLSLDGRYSLIGALCAYFEPGQIAHDLNEAPYGANMAFRKKMFDKYGTFRLDLGPCSTKRVSSEDTEFGRRLLAAGEKLRYVPTATVYHEIRQDRLNKKFFLTWWYGLGKGKVRESNVNLTVFETFKTLGRTLITAVEWLLSFAPQKRFYLKCRVWFGAGKLSEALQRTNQTRQNAGRQAEGASS
jgi:glucosyl-dolichyl phosphate glucuronosyltransferase